MNIEDVTPKDIKEIKRIADSLIVFPNQEKQTGFYDYSLSLEDYQKRIGSELFFLARNSKKIEGFCMAYTEEFIRKLIERDTHLRKDNIFDYMVKRENIIYIDQFAVSNPMALGNRTAIELWEEFLKRRGKKTCYGVIPHSPWKNKKSEAFFTHQGGQLVDKIEQDNISFGVYRLD